MKYLSKYQPTNNFSVQSMLMLVGVLLITSLVLGIAYAYAIIFIPLIYVNVLCTFGVGMVLVWIGEYFSERFLIQNPLGVKLIVSVMAVVAFVLSWLTWLSYYGFEEVLFVDVGIGAFLEGIWAFVQDPALLWDALLAMNEVGTRGIGKGSRGTGAVSGLVLLLVWVLEAGILLLYPAWLAGAQAKKPFDTQKNDWAASISTVHFPLMSAEQIEQVIADGAYSRFVAEELSEGESKDQSSFTFEVYELSDGRSYISATKYELEKDEFKPSELIAEYKEVPKQFVDYLRANKLLETGLMQ